MQSFFYAFSQADATINRVEIELVSRTVSCVIIIRVS